MPINGTDGTKCPPSREVPTVKAKCWTWSAKGLGHRHVHAGQPDLRARQLHRGVHVHRHARQQAHGERTSRPGPAGPDAAAHRRPRQPVPGEHRHVHRRHRERSRGPSAARSEPTPVGRSVDPGHGHRAEQHAAGVRHAHVPPQALTGRRSRGYPVNFGVTTIPRGAADVEPAGIVPRLGPADGLDRRRVGRRCRPFRGTELGAPVSSAWTVEHDHQWHLCCGRGCAPS